MFGMAVAASVMADGVTSGNTVGYMDMASASFKLITPVFEKIDGTAWTLADLKPVDIASWDFNSDEVHCYNGPSRVFVATYLTAAQAQGIVDDSGTSVTLDGNVITAVDGWYDADDVGEWGETGELKCYNTTQIPFGGSGFAIKSSVGVRFVGQVKEADQNLVSSSFRLVGNCSAANLTLADIKPIDIASWDFNSDELHCFNGPSRAFVATYLTAAQAQEIVNDSGTSVTLDGNVIAAVDGWYDADDVGEWGETGSLKCYNSTQLPAGAGFAVKSGVGVIIPSALQ